MPSLPSGSNACRPAAGLGSNGSSGPCLAQPPSQQTGSPPGPADGGTGGAAGAGQGGAAGASSAAAAGAVSAEAQGPLASKAIIDAAAAAGDSTNSGMHSLLKCGWVVAKVSDFGLSLCVQPEETHVSSVHAVSTAVPNTVMFGCIDSIHVHMHTVAAQRRRVHAVAMSIFLTAELVVAAQFTTMI